MGHIIAHMYRSSSTVTQNIPIQSNFLDLKIIKLSQYRYSRVEQI